MLTALSIRDIVLIGKLDLIFGKGLTVLTGETGAGKSIILDSLSLALGSRGNASLVRQGAGSGTVTASFDLPPNHTAFDALRDREMDDTEGLILRRVQYADGRTKAFVNGEPVSTAFLRQVAAPLVEIHGQHDDRALMDPASHRRLLDQYGGLTSDALEVQALWTVWTTSRKETEALKEKLAVSERESAYLTASAAELDQLKPMAGEEQALASRRAALQVSAKLRDDLEGAFDALSGQSFPALKINTILRRLERQAGAPEAIKPICEGLERVLIEADETRALVETELRRDGAENIEVVEERLFKLRAAARKHRVAADDLATLHARFLDDLENLQLGTDRLLQAQKSAEAASRDYAKAADALSAKRAAAAALLDAAVQKELKPLRLEKAKFMTHAECLTDEQDGVRGASHGRETIMFYVSTNPGAKPGPLMKVASGGELARFLLALKAVLAEKATAPVLVFDEIDTGVGGATAAAIGERLARIGLSAQVLAVTHSPQVAAMADAHYRLFKTAIDGAENLIVETSAEALDNAGRREEIARMLAGKAVTDEARAAAASLIGVRHEAG